MKKHFNKKRFGKPRHENDGDKRKYSDEKKWGEKNRHDDNNRRREEKPWQKRKDERSWSKGNEQKPWEKDRGREPKPWEKRREEKRFERKKDFRKKREENLKKAFQRSEKNSSHTKNISVPPAEGFTRLNKYLSNAGICSRREADTFIEAGAVKVNGKIITQLGYKVAPGDKVQFGDNTVRKEKTVYILLNKPRGYITTTDDERDRATVMELIQGIEERIYPVGRLDRNTSGLLLFTNDGELAKTLMHPKFNVAKVYHVVLDKSLKPDDLDKLKSGIELEDGFIKPDDIAYVDGSEGKKDIGIEIHSGRNRIVRRMFEQLGYNVEKLDRVLYAGLTKKNLGRCKWRFLSENEARMLKSIR